MSEIQAMLGKIRARRREHDGALREISEEQMGIETNFTFEQMITRRPGELTGADIRWIFLRRFDHMEEHAIQIEDHLETRFGRTRTQAQRYWTANEVARGDLYAALMGLTDDDLDVAPEQPAGEWPLRTTLEHLVNVERSYCANCLWAVEKFRAGETFEPMPRDDPETYADATLADFIEMLDSARTGSAQTLSDLPDEELRAPTVWMGMDCDLRFRLMRFAQHEREHTAQVRKWRVQTNKPFTDADRLMGMCWQGSGRLEGILAGAPDDVLDRDPGDGDWTVREILDHIASAEGYFKKVIDDALAR
ncbi:hypothetical protein BH23CHL2_BH23CHL2_05170 [soil metagenome]